MDINQKILILVLCIFIFAFVWGGCSSPEVKLTKHLERGNTFFNEGKYSEAIIDYRNVIENGRLREAPKN